MRTLLATVAASVVAAVPSAACSDPASSPAGGPGGSSTSAGTTIHVTIEDGDVTPDGARVEAHVGAPITLRIRADRSGELHVHSTPEQEVRFAKGASTRTLTIDRPGIVDVEDHALDRVVVQLEVS